MKSFSFLRVVDFPNISKLRSSLELFGYEFSLSPLPPELIMTGIVFQKNYSNSVFLGSTRFLNHFFTVKELGQLEDFSQIHRQFQWIIGRLLGKIAIQQLISALTSTEISLQNISIHQKRGLKPTCQIFPSQSLPIVDFSISHKKNVIIAVAAPFRVGVDLELKRPFSNHLTQKLLTDQDLLTINSLPESIKTEFSQNLLTTFFWSCKEAVLKAIGKGLRMGFQNLHVEYQNGQFLVRTSENDQFLIYAARFDDYIISCAYFLDQIKFNIKSSQCNK